MLDLSSNSLLDIQFFGSVVPLRNVDHPGLVVHHPDLVLSLIGDVIHLLLDVINHIGDIDNLGAIIQLFVVSPACFSIYICICICICIFHELYVAAVGCVGAV